MNQTLLPLFADFGQKGCLVLLFGLGLVLLLGREPSLARRRVLATVLMGLIALPVLSFVLPHWTAPITLGGGVAAPEAQALSEDPVTITALSELGTDLPTSLVQPNQEAKQGRPAPVGAMLLATTLLATQGAERVALELARSSFPLETTRSLLQAAAVPIWCLGVCLFLFRFFLASRELKKIESRSTPLLDRIWMNDLARQKQLLGVERDVELLIVSGLPQRELGPCTYGHLQPRILLPASATEWSSERRRVVLLHELGHVKRHDWLLRRVAQIACHLHFFNPLAWIALHRLTVEQERTCDETVIGAGIRPSRYAQHLLELAHGLTRSAPATTLSMAQPQNDPSKNNSKLEARLMRILESKPRRTLSFALPAALFSVLLVPLVAAMELQEPPEPDPPEAPRLIEVPDVEEFDSDDFSIAPVIVAPTPPDELMPSAPRAVPRAAAQEQPFSPPLAPTVWIAPAPRVRAVPSAIAVPRATPSPNAAPVAPQPPDPVVVSRISAVPLAAITATPPAAPLPYRYQQEEPDEATRRELKARLEVLESQQEALVEQIELTMEQTFAEVGIDEKALEEVALRLEEKAREIERRHSEVFGPHEKMIEELSARIEDRAHVMQEGVERQAEQMARLFEERVRLQELDDPDKEAQIEELRQRAEQARRDLSARHRHMAEELERETADARRQLQAKSEELRAKGEAMRNELEPLRQEMMEHHRELQQRHRDASRQHRNEARRLEQQLREISREMAKIQRRLESDGIREDERPLE